MADDLLTTSVATSVRYLRAYGPERLKEIEEIWIDFLDDPSCGVEAEDDSRVPEQESSDEISKQDKKTVIDPEPKSANDDQMPSFMQRLLGWRS